MYTKASLSYVVFLLLGAVSAAPVTHLGSRALPTPVLGSTARTYLSERKSLPARGKSLNANINCWLSV